jgi:hypothetical protein
MAKIRKSALLTGLLQKVEPQRFMPLLETYQATDRQGRYLHWNDSKWRVEPGHDEIAAWVATKVSRRSISNHLTWLKAKLKAELKAENDSCFSYCLPESLFSQ